ncbi:cupin domain-containing protein [Polynucleobacter sp. CS-Odin-A6]|uniref:cupin domain-containing protein n=1 Tax=Polynucleobacter sp. CS-Odin-A6 TaxID=2689106 RepID=UPI001C0B81D4|nr:cupin domain-containing protein [Polynucleobacter sp. CS-Odin-A6]MBU3619999.1 cupin domain-containing protein [Polynucleobacter sp. CS-Odin-A6]
MKERVFKSSNFLESNIGEPIRSVITESGDSAVIAWHVNPGQRISAHFHPHGQDTWIIQSGIGEYQTDNAGSTKAIKAGDVVVAHAGETHGVLNTGTEPLIFISVVSPALSGYELLVNQ